MKTCLQAYVYAPRSLGIPCPLTESLNTINVSMESKCPDETLRMRGMNLYFAHAGNHFSLDAAHVG